jgi:hypothetical protein
MAKKIYFPNDVKFSKETYYVGRNGIGRQTGLGITPDATSILLEPINSKGNLAHCEIRIPINEIPLLIAELTKFQQSL